MKQFSPSLTPQIHLYNYNHDVNDAIEDTVTRLKAEKKAPQQMKKNPSAEKPILEVELSLA